jgi:hypothetical protein
MVNIPDLYVWMSRDRMGYLSPACADLVRGEANWTEYQRIP